MATDRINFPDPLKFPEDRYYLCAGADLRPETLISAYSQGIFPWYGEGEPILWHCPKERCVLMPDEWHISARSRRKILHSGFTATMNMAFVKVMAGCASPRPGQNGTWILPEMVAAYTTLHELGYAHSVEIWQDDALVGGLYGVALGKVFFGESMFRRANEASRAALGALMRTLRQNNFRLVDCQQETPHMLAMGAKSIGRRNFLTLLKGLIPNNAPTPLASIRGPIPLA